MADITGPKATNWISATCIAVLALAPFAASAQAISSEQLSAPPGLSAPSADVRTTPPAKLNVPVADSEAERAAPPAAPAVRSVSSDTSGSALGHSTPGSTHKTASKKIADAAKVKKHKPLVHTADAGKAKPKHKALKPKTPIDGANS